MGTLLFVDACVNRDASRTERLARAFLKKRLKETGLDLVEYPLPNEAIAPLSAQSLASRNEDCASKDFSAKRYEAARLFAEADEVVIAAPYWDLSFPASLKIWCENICVNGLTFSYGADGRPHSQCAFRSVFYVTTVGGYLGDYNMGFDYIKGLCDCYFGAPSCECIAAEGLDIVGNDAEAIMDEACAKFEN